MTKERERSHTGPSEKRPGTRGTYARSRKQRKSGLPAWVYIAVVALVVVLAGGGAMALLGPGGASNPATTNDVGSSGGSGSSGVQLPRYAYVAPQVTEAYQYAVTQAGQEVLQYMPCYCGCGDHSGHMNTKNCFVKDTAPGQPLVFDNHGST